ncbi:tyrosine-type recombinase/integrase [Nonomuraea sp. KM90]|uniref:tyrosine-type recombinase/integrase n=1 Tax=Nonomuraea sp. KM90 TaxID=3457428 RepID=UPI003FCD64FF
MTAEPAVARGEEVALPLVLPPLVVEITHLWLETRRSPNTRDAYRRAIRPWFTYCERIGLDPLEMSVRHAELYARWMVETAVAAGDDPPAPKTIAQRMSAVSAWYKYLIKNDAARFNPFAEAGRPNIPRRRSETAALTEGEAHALVEAADKDHGRERLRTAALIRLLVQVGVRISEAVDAQVDDLGFARGYRTLRLALRDGKPHHRKLPVETAYALDRYLAERARRAGVALRDLRGPLFATASGRPLPREKAWELVQRIARQAGIESKVTPHTLRHTWASVAEARGAKPREIQEALAHESFETTLIYLRSRDRLEEDPSQLVASAIE